MPFDVEGRLAEIHREIESLVSDALVRFRVGGSPRIEGGRILLVGDGPTVGVEVGALSELWPTLAPALKRARATEIAQWLAQERRSLLPARSWADLARLPRFVAPLAILAVAALTVWLTFRILGPQPRNSAQLGADAEPEDSEAARQAREARVCEATLERVDRGTPIGPADAEGWVVEVMMLRAAEGRDLFDDPALAAFVERMPGQSSGRLRWNGAPQLAGTTGVDTGVRLGRADLGDPVQPNLRGLTLTFTGRYVGSYFREQDRLEYLGLAAALSERLKPKYAALYARCTHLTSHHLGSWFLGPGADGAATSLVYFMGTYAPISHVKSSVLRIADGGTTFDRVFALGEIAKAMAPLDRDRVLDQLGKHGGMIAGRPESAMTISFPFKDGSRAARASHDFAQSSKIARE
jgi:hypothetical protein